MAKKRKKPLTMLEAYKSLRKTWGGFRPDTKIVPNKKKQKDKDKCRKPEDENR